MPPQHIKDIKSLCCFPFSPPPPLSPPSPSRRTRLFSLLSFQVPLPFLPAHFSITMVAFAPFVALLALAPTAFAAPMALHSYEGRSYFSRHRWARRATLASEPPCEDPTNPDPNPSTTISSVKASPTKSFGDASQVWPMSVSNAKAIW